jgi:hypothetical protein
MGQKNLLRKINGVDSMRTIEREGRVRPKGKFEKKHKGKRSFLKKRTKRLLSFDAIPNISVMASTFPRAQEQKSFGSFLQKRTFFFPRH